MSLLIHIESQKHRRFNTPVNYVKHRYSGIINNSKFRHFSIFLAQPFLAEYSPYHSHPPPPPKKNRTILCSSRLFPGTHSYGLSFTHSQFRVRNPAFSVFAAPLHTNKFQVIQFLSVPDILESVWILHEWPFCIHLSYQWMKGTGTRTLSWWLIWPWTFPLKILCYENKKSRYNQ